MPEVAVDLVRGVHVEQVGADVFFQLRVDAFLRVVAAAERGVHVDQPRGAPAGAYAAFSGKAAAVVHGFLDGGGVFRGVEHIPFISREQAVQVADVAMPLLDFLKGVPAIPGCGRPPMAGWGMCGRNWRAFASTGVLIPSSRHAAM